jgi:hypothetical protein
LCLPPLFTTAIANIHRLLIAVAVVAVQELLLLCLEVGQVLIVRHIVIQ